MAAECQFTEKELQACFGWLTNTQSARCTERANRARLAKSAAEKISGNAYSLTSGQVQESSENFEPEQEVMNERRKDGGRYWTRTSDPCDVNTVLYQLS